MSLFYEDKIFWGRSLYCNLSLTSKRGENCERRMRSPLMYGILSPTHLLAGFTETVVSLLHHLPGCTSLLLPSSPLEAELASQTTSKLTQGKNLHSFQRLLFQWVELNCWGVRQVPVHQENKTERYRVKAGCEIGLNIIKLYYLSPGVEPAARGVCSRVWTSALSALADGEGSY